jgi:hypothetical protein
MNKFLKYFTLLSVIIAIPLIFYIINIQEKFTTKLQNRCDQYNDFSDKIKNCDNDMLCHTISTDVSEPFCMPFYYSYQPTPLIIHRYVPFLE